ncbi:MAG: DUF4956 domain-containing protein [Clostridia bacterium]|nr:DUF4956 domain-containing protein [Clostridia bacterium]
MPDIISSLTGNADISIGNFLIPIIASLILGVILTLINMYRNKSSRSFAMTLVILPAIVCTVIMAVNGNIGAGIAVAGAFTLVKFRSAPGSAREIGTLFTAMAAGLLTGMGYILYALLFVLVIGAAILICQFLHIGEHIENDLKRNLRITIPEELDYTGVFDEIMKKYTTEYKLMSSRTTNMGSLFKLSYDVTLRSAAEEKAFIDDLRCRNGNLEISISSITEKEAPEL